MTIAGASASLPPISQAKASLLSFIIAIAIWLIGFLGAAALIRALLPFPQVSEISPKYRHFAAHRDEYEVLFLGSSRVFHQIIPHEFDALTAAQTGRPVRSFNAGMDGLWPPESLYLLRQLLALRPAHLKWVFIEVMNINPRAPSPERITNRLPYWHDWPHTWMALRWLNEPQPDPPKNPLQLTRMHLSLFGERTVSLGRGAEELQPWLRQDRSGDQRPPAWRDEEGFHAEPATPLSDQERVSFTKALAELRVRLPEVPPSPALRSALEGAAAAVRAAGAEPIFLLMPTVHGEENFAGAPGGAASYRFNDPQQFPELFDLQIYYDAYHLNAVGAHLLTRLIAERFARTLAP